MLKVGVEVYRCFYTVGFNLEIGSIVKKGDVSSDRAPARRPGRPRDLVVRQAILVAARAILDESGVAGVTMEGVAARAGVGKPTVYRWWADRHAVAMAALMDAPPEKLAPTRRASPLRTLQRQLVMTARTLSTRTGRHVAQMIAASEPQTELSKAFRNHFILARRDEGRSFLEQAMAAGELRADIDLDLALDEIYGAVFFRLLLGHASIDETFVKRLLGQVLSGLKPAKT
jgi:AcrR family transcriptional regulator